MTDDVPAPHLICPLCGGANACAPAQSGRFDVACWCTTASFDAGLLARVPEALRGVSCICSACATSAAAASP
ncbi:MAG: cysteine-rich CWC family protein [Caldimonas sp.]